MAPSRVVGFVKFFSDESHADQFIEGSLFMRRLRHFQQLEAPERDDGRPDNHEAVTSWYQPDQIELEFNFVGFESIKIGKNDLAGPLAVTRNFYSDMYLFCMSTLSIPDPSLMDGNHTEIQEKLQSEFQIDARCLNFGPHAVFVKADKFIPQLRQALGRCNHWFKAGMVKYYDESTFHGDFAEQDAPFRKRSRFAYQREFRVCLQTPTAGEEPLNFEIGDISAFAFKVRSADINDRIKFRLNAHLLDSPDYF